MRIESLWSSQFLHGAWSPEKSLSTNLSKKALILEFQVFEPKATSELAGTNMLQSHKTLGPMTRIISHLEEGLC